MIDSQNQMTVSAVSRLPRDIGQSSFTDNFFEIKKFETKHWKKLRCLLKNIRLHSQTAHSSEANSFSIELQLDVRNF